MGIVIDFSVLSLIYILAFLTKWRRRGRAKLLLNTLMYIYVSFVLFFTLMPVLTSLPHLLDHGYATMNMTPFSDVVQGHGDFARQVLLNVVMMIPFGFLLPLVREKTGFFRAAAYTFLFSLGIELLQPLLNAVRSSDITDLITNTCGGMVGYALYSLSLPLITKMLRAIEREKG